MTGTKESVVDVVITGDRTVINVSSEESQKLFLHSWKDRRVFMVRTFSCDGHQLVATTLLVPSLLVARRA